MRKSARLEAFPTGPDIDGFFLAFLTVLIRFYQALHGMFFFGSCRFVPTCSSYTLEALQVHGAGRGLWLGVRRICRCQPFCRGGFDPVPPAAERGPDRRNNDASKAAGRIRLSALRPITGRNRRHRAGPHRAEYPLRRMA